MCGRFTQKFTWPELIELYRLTQTPQNLRAAYNVCPTDPVSVIIPGEKGLFLMPRCRPECGRNFLGAISSNLKVSDHAARSIG